MQDLLRRNDSYQRNEIPDSRGEYQADEEEDEKHFEEIKSPSPKNLRIAL
eukprot:CAMPEP_0202969836 /NCGR_PEP_ID=MMETSP1396-20130829/15717_1 /ASSEMBLY_ACC=CAM_ASM_000872 /TAXON_ID= /ORGANISM="Pseudokeronopsis sp., Strain Brazil" /LENGTH=49 /DNA_ID= /DNA_START= /DNA_END= /DNA_ORIENTATION=